MEAAGPQAAPQASCPSCGAAVALAPGAPCPVCGAPAPADPHAAGAGPQSPSGYAAQPGSQPPPPGYPAPPPAPDSAAGAVSQAGARDVVTWVHLSALVGLVGIPSPLGPLVVWLARRESHPFVDDQGKEALNFNLSALIYAIMLFVGGFLFSLVTLGFGLFLFIPLGIAAIVAWLVAVVVGAVKGSKGELFRYPLTIRFVR